MATRIGILPPRYSFESFTSLFNEALVEFFLNQKMDIPNVFLSRIFASEESFRDLLPREDEEPTHLKIIKEIISDDLPPKHIVSYLAATRSEQKATMNSIKELVTEILNSKHGGFYGFGGNFFARNQISKETVELLERSVITAYKCDSFYACCLEIYQAIKKKGKKIVVLTIKETILKSHSNIVELVGEEGRIERVSENFTETADMIAQVFKNERNTNE